MALTDGSQLGPYKIEEPIGAGGMGEVYQALDTRLNRRVALKVLPEAFASDPQRMARFEREAQVLAALSHHHIAAIYGLEEGEPSPALVMELVEGETLAERIARGPLPIEEALPIAGQIAEALEYAHDRGVIHRDLKPANVKLTPPSADHPEGTVKVLDFGLAKAMGPEEVSRDISSSPTLSAAMTQAGFIIGTASYMAPEQARAKPVDRRADIWAFGVVLWEMLTGRKLFDGETVSDTLAAILTRKPDFSELPSSTPQRIRELLGRCLERDPRVRLRDIGEARIAIEAATSGGDDASLRPVAGNRVGIPLAIFIISLVGAVAVSGFLAWQWSRQSGAPVTAAPKVTEFSIWVDHLYAGWPTAFELSEDGRRIAWETESGEKGRTLWVRDLDDRKPREVTSDHEMGIFFWSPDGSELAVDIGGRMWRIPAAGGERQLICDLPELEKVPARYILAGAWLPDDTVLFAAWRGGIYRVPARGGDPELYVPIDPKVDVDFHRISVLPDGKSLLLDVHHQSEVRSQRVVAAFELFRDGKRTPAQGTQELSDMVPLGYTGATLAVANSEGDAVPLWGVPFDPATCAVVGKKFILIPRMSGASVARDGTLAYVSPQERPGVVTRINRSGTEIAPVGSPHPQLVGAAMSPDGSRLALVVGDSELWVEDLSRGTFSRLDQAGRILGPQWSRDGRTIYYSAESDAPEIRLIRADPGAQPETVLGGSDAAEESAYLAPDGNGLLIRKESFQLSEEQGLYWAPFESDGKLGERRLLLRGPSVFGRLAPGSRMLAYSRIVGDQRQAFLTTFPALDQTIQLSSAEGGLPQWDPEGKSVYYLSEGTMVQVDVDLDNAGRLTATRERRLFDLQKSGLSRGSWSVAPDGRGFLFIKPLAGGDRSEIVVARNGMQRAEASSR
ncbi:MAG: protein kinase [Acidobacteriota bacterium]